MRRAVVLALALWGVLAASASAQVVDDDPAAASRAYNDARLFARAADGTILQRSGLEWLFRLSREPRRLWRRYLRYNPRFVASFARQLVAHRAAGENRRVPYR